MMRFSSFSVWTLLFSLWAFGSVSFADAPTYQSKNYGKYFSTGLVRTAQSRSFLQSSPRHSFVASTQAIPGKYSMRGQAGPVEAQGKCGSCWDFSLTSVLRGTKIMTSKDPGRLSFNYLLNCAAEFSGCEGGDFTAAQYMINPKGVPLYGSDGGEYTATDGACVSAPVAASSAHYYLLGDDGGNFPQGKVPSFKDLAYVLSVLHRPVSIDVAVDDLWHGYAGGIYNGCSDEKEADINHMVSLEGYDCETSVDSSGNCVFDANGNLPAGVGTWIIRNSWGDAWGDQGYITTKATDAQGLPCNAVATDALYFDL